MAKDRLWYVIPDPPFCALEMAIPEAETPAGPALPVPAPAPVPLPIVRSTKFYFND